MPVLSVVIPAFNEQRTIMQVVETVRAIPVDLEIIIVDDCSTDGTAESVADLCKRFPNVRSFRHEKNAGKTGALVTGFAETRGDIVIVQDADLECNPNEIPGVIAPILEGNADVVYGSRFLARRGGRVVYFYHSIGNRLLTLFSNVLTNLNMTDVETCYKAFRGDIIRNMIITSAGFGFEIEVTAKVAKLKCPIYEVPISYNARGFEEGKKIGIADGFAALWYVVRYNLFCSLERCYREVPQLGKKQTAAVGAAASSA